MPGPQTNEENLFPGSENLFLSQRWLSRFRETTNTSLLCFIFKEGHEMILKNIMLSKRSQTQKSIFMKLQKTQNQSTVTKGRPMVAWGKVWERTEYREAGVGRMFCENGSVLYHDWQWLHRNIHLSKLIKLYVYFICKLYLSKTDLKARM